MTAAFPLVSVANATSTKLTHHLLDEHAFAHIAACHSGNGITAVAMGAAPQSHSARMWGLRKLQ
jgi:hypothetical protein